MTRQALPGPPGPLPHGDVGTADVLQHRGAEVRAVIDDAQPTARPQNPHCLAQRLCPPASFPDVADRQAADHNIERRGPKRKVTRVRVDKLHPVAHAVCDRIALGGGATVAALVAAAPSGGSVALRNGSGNAGSAARGLPARPSHGRHEDCGASVLQERRLPRGDRAGHGADGAGAGLVLRRR